MRDKQEAYVYVHRVKDHVINGFVPCQNHTNTAQNQIDREQCRPVQVQNHTNTARYVTSNVISGFVTGQYQTVR